MEKQRKNIASSEELLRYKKRAREISDVRQDKVDEIKKKIESGEYKIDAEAVAGKILELAQDVDKATRKKCCK